MLSTGETQTYSLWSKDSRAKDQNRFAGDVRKDLEVTLYSPDALSKCLVVSRAVQITEATDKEFMKYVSTATDWRVGDTCATWSTGAWKIASGETINSSEFFWFRYIDTPRTVWHSLFDLENPDFDKNYKQ